MRFGDIILQQLKGITMGMSPSPCNSQPICSHLRNWSHYTNFQKYFSLYLSFIGDGLAVWEHHNNPSLDKELLQAFKVAINNSGLKWTFTTLSSEVEFMDLTITLKEGVFLKKLYIWDILPHSCHPSGCFSALVTGMVWRIYRLCSLYCHIKGWLKDFYGHLLDRGYPPATIKPLFIKTVRRAEEYISSNEEYIL